MKSLDSFVQELRLDHALIDLQLEKELEAGCTYIEQSSKLRVFFAQFEFFR